MDNTDKEITAISLFSGYGGLDLGVRRIIPNLRVVAYVEIEAYASELLAQKIQRGEMDEAPIFTDVTQFPAHLFRDKVHLVIAGYPCQDFSCAGNREGLEGNRGKMWGFTRAIVNGCNARAFFGENVDGHLSLGFDTVVSDLAEDGFVVKGGLYSAFEVGAPHLRKRIFSLSFRTDPREEPWASRNRGNQGWVDIDDAKFQALTTGTVKLGDTEYNGLLAEQELRSDEEASHQWSEEEPKETEQPKGADRPDDGASLSGSEQRGYSTIEGCIRQTMGYPIDDGHTPAKDSRETGGGEEEGWMQESEGGGNCPRIMANNESERRGCGDQASGGDARRIQDEEGEIGRDFRCEAGGSCGSDGELADPDRVGFCECGRYEELGEEKGREGEAGYQFAPTSEDESGDAELCLTLARLYDEGFPSTRTINGEQTIVFDEPRIKIRWPARPGEPQNEWEQPRTIAEEEAEPIMGGKPDAVTRGLHENRIERLRMLGNGVVWLTASKAFSELIDQHEQHFKELDKSGKL